MFTTEYAPLAQLDRASVYGTEGWGFELLMVHQEVIIRIVSSSQVIGSDLLFISEIPNAIGLYIHSLYAIMVMLKQSDKQ